MAYVAQLLPDLEQARVIRAALVLLIDHPETTEEAKDVAWELMAKLTSDMRRNAHR